MSWFILALVSIVTLSIAVVLQRVLMKDKDSDPVAYTIVFQFILGVISLMFAFGFGKFVLPSLWELIFRIIISGGLWAGATVFSFKAAKSLSAGQLTILTTTSSIISIILGVLLLKEVINLSLILGTVFILLSVWIVNSERASFGSKSGVLFALLSAVFVGIASVNDAFILRQYEAFSYTAVISFFPSVILLILFPEKFTRVKKLLSNTRIIKVMSVFCLLISIQAISYYLALQSGAPLSQLAPLIKSSSVITVILGAIFLNERKQFLRTFIASLIVVMGVFLLS